jgi:hypothetical protein
MRPTGVRGEVSIISAANELAMDATRATSDGIQPLMSRPNGEPWQHWRLKPSVDGDGFLIKSPRTGNCLTLTKGAREKLHEQWAPWLSEQKGGPDQKWIISLPDGSTGAPPPDLT